MKKKQPEICSCVKVRCPRFGKCEERIIPSFYSDRKAAFYEAVFFCNQ